MIVAHLVFSWPQEAQYSVDPSDYDGCAIEDYSLEILSTSMEVGDTRHWDGRLWKVARIDHYLPSKEEGAAFAEVLLTLDGSIPERDTWDNGDSRLMYVCFNGEDFEIGWPTHPKFLPEVGDHVADMEGYEITTVQEFSNAGLATPYYDHVRVCWCAPIRVGKPEMAAASA